MKTVLLCTLLCFSSLLFAQSAQNDNFRMEYVTYAQQHIVLNAKSLVSCGNLEVRMRWGSKDTTLFFTPLEQRQVMLPSSGGTVQVQAKTVTSCNNAFNGPWISLSLTTLSLREEGRIRRQPAPVPAGSVRVIAINGSDWREMTEGEFQKRKAAYRHRYFILRRNKAKEIML